MWLCNIILEFCTLTNLYSMHIFKSHFYFGICRVRCQSTECLLFNIQLSLWMLDWDSRLSLVNVKHVELRSPINVMVCTMQYGCKILNHLIILSQYVHDYINWQKTFTLNAAWFTISRSWNCFAGHFGHIRLPTPIYHPSHVEELKWILSKICLNCFWLKELKVIIWLK
jgi:hypothetical protein